MNKLMTSESISIGHPDRLADNISNAILTDLLKHDADSHVGLEVFLANDVVILGGEVSTKHVCDYEGIAREVIFNTGYNDEAIGYNGYKVAVENHINRQSPDIAIGVNRGEGVIGAGDQGIMFGYATNETKEYYPLAATIANKLILRYQEYLKSFYATRNTGNVVFPSLRPDAKAQVTIDYTTHKIDTIVFSASHVAEVGIDFVRKEIVDKIFKPVLTEYSEMVDNNTKYLINPTGRFVKCGPVADAGLTGRKLAVDSYGGYANIGGGNTNGKDPSKVDMSAARAARHAAKNLVAAGIANEITIQLSYAIGVAEPISIKVDAAGSDFSNEEIAEKLAKIYDFTPVGIIENLHLTNTDFTTVCYYNQFCGTPGINNGLYLFPWEELNLVEAFKSAFFGGASIGEGKPAGESNAKGDKSVAQIIVEKLSSLMLAFIEAKKFSSSGKVVKAVKAAFDNVPDADITPEKVAEILIAAKLDFLAEAFKRLCNGDDINVIVEESSAAFTEDKTSDETKPEEAASEQRGETTAKGKKKTTK